MNDENSVALRRYCKSIELNGWAIMLSAIWTSVKSLIPVFMGQKSLDELLGIAGDIEMQDMRGVLIFFEILYVILIILFHWAIGNGAIKYSKGSPKKFGFLFGAILLFLVNAISVPFYFISLERLEDIDSTVATFIVDVTMIIILLDLIISTIKVASIRKTITAEK